MPGEKWVGKDKNTYTINKVYSIQGQVQYQVIDVNETDAAQTVDVGPRDLLHKAVKVPQTQKAEEKKEPEIDPYGRSFHGKTYNVKGKNGLITASQKDTKTGNWFFRVKYPDASTIRVWETDLKAPEGKKAEAPKAKEEKKVEKKEEKKEAPKGKEPKHHHGKTYKINGKNALVTRS